MPKNKRILIGYENAIIAALYGKVWDALNMIDSN